MTLMPDAADGSNGACTTLLQQRVDAVINTADGSLAILNAGGTNTVAFPRLTGFLAKDK